MEAHDLIAYTFTFFRLASLVTGHLYHTSEITLNDTGNRKSTGMKPPQNITEYELCAYFLGALYCHYDDAT